MDDVKIGWLYTGSITRDWYVQIDRRGYMITDQSYGSHPVLKRNLHEGRHVKVRLIDGGRAELLDPM